MASSAAYIVFLPMIAAIVAGFGRHILGDKGAQFVTCLSILISAFLSLRLFGALLSGGLSETVFLLPWIVSGDFIANWSLRIDTLSVMMFVVVTVVSSVVHLYSVGYMSHDPAKARFMSYLSLFTFAMLMLVSSDNLIQMFFGWEGVGVASYLLIGFWNQKDSANSAAMKAFLVNRVGDFGYALGIMGVFLLFGTVGFDDIFAQLDNTSIAALTWSLFGYDVHALTVTCLLLFMGAMGKSAQLGLHTWLPDAMEGPTPVSALIHAATMVTAGVFMVARLSPLFETSPFALSFITVIGALTALLAATIALTQNDIKRVIAYSTMSQLGYMFFALGVSAYGAALFHLFTHAFFKALLFLGAGSVIHALHDEQDLRNMGGLWKKLPVTYAYMWVGSLALAGIPIFAGYYSKDIILEAAYAVHTGIGSFAFWCGIAAAFMTAFYSWRLLLMTFHGKPRMTKKVFEKAHESGLIMNVPMFALALGAVFSGAWGYEYFVGHYYTDFWNGTLAEIGYAVIDKAHHVPGWVIFLPLAVGTIGIGLAYLMYNWTKGLPETLATRLRPLYILSNRKWFFDEFYDWLFVRSSMVIGAFFSQWGDRYVIDGFGPDGVSKKVVKAAKSLSAFQSGYIFRYVIAMLVGFVVILTILFIKNKDVAGIGLW